MSVADTTLHQSEASNATGTQLAPDRARYLVRLLTFAASLRWNDPDLTRALETRAWNELHAYGYRSTRELIAYLN